VNGLFSPQGTTKYDRADSMEISNMMTDDEVFDSGANAAANGLSLADNPYAGNMRYIKTAVRWAEGWHSNEANYPGQQPLRLDEVEGIR